LCPIINISNNPKDFLPLLLLLLPSLSPSPPLLMFHIEIKFFVELGTKELIAMSLSELRRTLICYESFFFEGWPEKYVGVVLLLSFQPWPIICHKINKSYTIL
ncbi:hypothetical protein PanWU01x14_254790, partial [Parasponia andersonii]